MKFENGIITKIYIVYELKYKTVIIFNAKLALTKQTKITGWKINQRYYIFYSKMLSTNKLLRLRTTCFF